MRRVTCSLRPRRRVESPVPPPRATTRKPRERELEFEARFFIFGSEAIRRLHSTGKNSTQRSRRPRRRERQDGLKPAATKTAGKHGKGSGTRAVLLRIEQFGKARVFLEKSKVLIIARVIAVFRAELDGDLEIGQSGIGFAGKTIERGQSVMNMVGLGCGFAGFVETFARVIPAANVHHGDAPLIVFFGGARILLVRRPHALLGDLDVHARAVGKFFAGTFQNFFELLLGPGRSEEHTSELQSRRELVCRLLLEKKKKKLIRRSLTKKKKKKTKTTRK